MWMNVSVIHVDPVPGIELYNYCYFIYSVLLSTTMSKEDFWKGNIDLILKLVFIKNLTLC